MSVRQRVEAARAVQLERGGLNRAMRREQLDAQPWEPKAMMLLEQAFDRQEISGRGYDRIRRVARTIADLGGSERVEEPHAAEALSYRWGWS